MMKIHLENLFSDDLSRIQEIFQKWEKNKFSKYTLIKIDDIANENFRICEVLITKV